MDRIEALPRRNWRETADVEAMTARYRTSAGAQTFRAIQAVALAEAEQLRGLFLHGRVGCGKTLTAALLPRAFKARKPLLVVPAKGNVVADTIKQHSRLRLHWQVPTNITIVSYEFLSQPQNAGWLERHQPDAVICDEGHKLKAIATAAGAIQMARYLHEHQQVRFAVLSGTLTPHGVLKDFAHLLIWSLRNRAPIPLEPKEIAAWGRALEGTGDPEVILGASSYEEALELFAERLRETPGVVISDDVFEDVPLTINYHLVEAPEATRKIYYDLRNYWEAPDGWSFGDDAFQVAATARQFGNDFSYRHDPRPSPEFLAIRKAWTNYCRDVIESGDGEASEGQIALRCRTEGGEGSEELAAWEDASAAFPLITVADWHALDTLEFAKQWAKPRGIIWAQHVEVGEALEKYAGIPFFHGQTGRNLLDEDGSRCVCTSIQYGGTAKNLQGPFDPGVVAGPFYHNLLLNPPANGEAIEQLAGRTHREGQKHPVSLEFYIACREHRTAVMKSIAASEKISIMLSPQKMRSAAFPPMSLQDHPAWQQAHRIPKEE